MFFHIFSIILSGWNSSAMLYVHEFHRARARDRARKRCLRPPKMWWFNGCNLSVILAGIYNNSISCLSISAFTFAFLCAVYMSQINNYHPPGPVLTTTSQLHYIFFCWMTYVSLALISFSQTFLPFVHIEISGHSTTFTSVTFVPRLWWWQWWSNTISGMFGSQQ
jgi:hypothetical protein